jgi:hypothetical protein
VRGPTQPRLTDEEREGITTAVQSTFKKLKNLYLAISTIFQSYGFTAPSPGVIARDLSEKIEASIIQHCASFSKGLGHCDLCRGGHDWEVKIAKKSGLTINQSKQIAGENYIVVNYTANSQVRRIFVLWGATDVCFSPRRSNTNARSLIRAVAEPKIEILYESPTAGRSNRLADLIPAPVRRATMAKARLRSNRVERKA